MRKRVEFVRQTRAASKAEGTRKFAETPTLFCQIAQPDSDYIIVPKTSSGRRRYIPLGFMDKDTIASDLVFLIPNAGLYEFGVLMSNVHNAWMRLVAGRLKSDYRYSNAHRFISTLPGGYNMELNEEITNISQGQKQLLTIARAILADNPVLILDEATSSVDTRTEHRIQRAMDNLMKGRTSFVIAHRLSTIKNADIILVMKDGDIIEQGNHDELMAQNGFYADLYNSQWS